MLVNPATIAADTLPLARKVRALPLWRDALHLVAELDAGKATAIQELLDLALLLE